MSVSFLESLLQSKADPPILLVSRAEVEARVTNRIVGMLSDLAIPRYARAFRQRIWIGVDGYDEDERELPEIPEVREWFHEFDTQWPYCFFFLDPGLPMNLLLFAAAWCGIEYTRPTGIRRWFRRTPALTDKAVFRWNDPIALGRFMENHFGAMNFISDQLGDSDQVNAMMTQRVLTAFRMEAPE